MSSATEGQPLVWVRARVRLQPRALMTSRPWLQSRFDHSWAPMQALGELVGCLPSALWALLMRCEGGFVVITRDETGYRAGPSALGDRTVDNVAYLSLEDLAGDRIRAFHVIGHLIDHYLGCAGAQSGLWLTGGGGLTADWQEAGARLPRLFALGYGVAEAGAVDERDYFAQSLALYCQDRQRLNVTDPQIEKWFRSVLWNERLWTTTLGSLEG